MRKQLLCVFAMLLIATNIFAGNFNFPQNADYPYGITVTNKNTTKIAQLYNSWVNDFYAEGSVTVNGASVDAARIKYDVASITVSEGIAYGMLIFVYMEGVTETNNFKSISVQDKFDKLYNYYSGFSRFQSGTRKYLMDWKINGFTGVNEAGSATDADIDVALALLMAHQQWGSSTSNYGINYLAEAETLIGLIYDKQTSNYIIKPGDHWDNALNPCYFEVAALNLFDEVQSSQNFKTTKSWSSVVSKSYDYLENAQNDATGLYPDWSDFDGNKAGTFGYDFSWDACRTPWRVIWDYAWYGNTEAQTLSQTTLNWVDKNVTASSCTPGYSLTGTPFSANYQSPCFVGGLGSVYMLSSTYSSDLQTWYDQSLDIVPGAEAGKIPYYGKTLQILYALTMSGNTPNFYANSTPAAARLLSIETDASTGTSLTLNFSKDLQTVSSSAASSFSVSVDGSVVAVTNLTYSGLTSNQIILTIGNATVTNASIIRVSYNGTSVKDVDGLSVETFSNQLVKNNLAGTGTILCDFENDELTSLGTSIYTFGAGAQTIYSPKTSDTDAFTTTTGGAAGTDNAGKLSFTLNGSGISYNPLAGIGFAFSDPEAAYDLSSSKGISFWYKGNAFTLELALSTITNNQNFAIDYPATNDWTKVDIEWSSTNTGGFEQANWSPNNIYVDWDLTKVTKLQWKAQDVTGTVGELWVDEVMLLTGDAVDKSELDALIIAALAIYNPAIEGDKPGEYEVGSKSIFNSAILSAKATLQNSSATDLDVNTAISNLTKAIVAFESKIILPGNTLIADGETGNSTKLNTFWFSYADKTSTITPKSTETVPFVMTAGGANGTDSSAYVSGYLAKPASPDYESAGIGFDLNADKTAYDLSAATGFSFWHKGSALVFNVAMEGILADKGYEHFIEVPQHNSWTLVEVDFTELAQPDWMALYGTATDKANVKDFDPSKALKLQWQVKEGSARNFAFGIDEVTVVGATLDLPVIVNVDKTALNQAIGTAQTVYNTAVVGSADGQYPSKTALNNAITAANTIYSNTKATQIEVNNAVTTLNKAVADFKLTVIVINKQTLTERIEYAQDIFDNAKVGTNPKEYPSSAKTTFESAINDAKGILTNTGVSQSQVNTAVETLNAAITTFEESVNPETNIDTSSLSSLINETNTFASNAVIGTNINEYPADAKKLFTDAISLAENVKNNPLTQDRVTKAINDLTAAFDDFKASKIKEVVVDKTELTSLILIANTDLTGATTNDYQQEAIDNFEKAIEKAKSVNNSKTATQTDVTDAIAKLQDAIDDFESYKIIPNVVNKTYLNDLIEWSENAIADFSTNPKLYNVTAKSLLEKYITDAKTVSNNIDATQDDVNEIVEKLYDKYSDFITIEKTDIKESEKYIAYYYQTGIISISSDIEIKSVAIINIKGYTVYNETVNANSATISSSSLKHGTYFVIATLNSGEKLKQTIIK